MNWAQFVAACIPEPKTLQVQIWQGSGAHGDVHATAVAFGPCVVDNTTRTVTVETVETRGEEHLSSTTVFGPLTPTVVAGSLVALPGRTGPARVLAVARRDAHGLDLPEHQELSLE